MPALNNAASRAVAAPGRFLLRGFTLVELLVVIAIIGILVALLLPAVQAAREAARRAHCVNNLKQLGLAMHNYHDAHNVLPYASACCQRNDPYHFPGDPRATWGGVWSTMLLPFFEENSLYDRIDFNKYNRDLDASVVTTVIPTYACPSDSGGDVILDKRFARDNPSRAMGLWYTASMGPTKPELCKFSSQKYACQGNNFGSSGPPGNSVGMFGRHPKAIKFSDVRDGLSKTLMLGETLPRQCAFFSAFAVNFNVSSTQIPLNTFDDDTKLGENPVTGNNWWRTSGFKSEHPGGANFCLGDGSVHFFSEAIDYRLYNNLGTRDGMEVVEMP